MREGFELIFNLSLDGKCQFIVIIYHFRNIEIYLSEKTLRHEMVSDSITNPAFGGTNFIPNFLDIHWEDYLYERKSDGTFDDEHYMLCQIYPIAISSVFNIFTFFTFFLHILLSFLE